VARPAVAANPAAARSASRARLRRRLGTLGFYALLIALVVPAVFPFYWMAISSIKPEPELFAVSPSLAPGTFSTEFYDRLLIGTPFWRYFLNSLIVAGATMVLVCVVAVFAAYALARFRFGAREPFALSLLIGQMFPSVLLAIPLFVILSQVGLLDSYAGLVVAYLTFALPFTTWMLRGYFMSVPEDLEEAAMIDGCSRMGAMLRITLPLTAPGIAATAILGFMLAWNDYLFAAILLNQEELKTLPIGLSGYISPWRIDYGVLMSGSVMATIPVVLFFILVQRYIIAGLTAGAVKG
jgi:multiple sugar transport system permease protein/raffinose/stachyose/melibiose transport system permease protein